MADESPTIEEPQEPKDETQGQAPDLESLVKTLEEFDVTPEKLPGKLRNAQDFAHMQSERDRYANELSQLRAELSEMNKQRQQPQSFDNIDDYQEGKPIDIESLIVKGVDKAISAREQRAQQHQARMTEYWNRITNHPKYHLVRDEFENALKDPATVMKLQSGQVDPMGFYYDMLVDKYAGVTKQAVEGFKKMQGSRGVSPPHVEGQVRAPGRSTDDRTTKDKKLDELRKRRDQSPLGLQHDDEIDSFLDAALGDI